MSASGLFYAVPTVKDGVQAPGYYSSESIHMLLSQDATLTQCEDRDEWRIISFLLSKQKQKQVQGQLILRSFCLDNTYLADWLKGKCLSNGKLLDAEHNLTANAVLLRDLGSLLVTSTGTGWKKKFISWQSISSIPDSLTEGGAVVRCQGSVSEGDHLLFEDSFTKASGGFGGEATNDLLGERLARRATCSAGDLLGGVRRVCLSRGAEGPLRVQQSLRQFRRATHMQSTIVIKVEHLTFFIKFIILIIIVYILSDNCLYLKNMEDKYIVGYQRGIEPAPAPAPAPLYTPLRVF
jgi:hypothetical protein